MLLSVRPILILLCVLSFGAAVSAEDGTAAEPSKDRIELTSGDVLLGRIMAESDGEVTLDHPVLGEIHLPRGQIAEILRAEPPTAATAPETAPDAPAEPQPVEDPPQAPPLSEAKPGGNDATPPAEPAAADDEAALTLEEPEPDKSLLDQLGETLEDWNVQLALGFSDRASNVNTFSFHTRLDAKYTDDDDRWRINAAYHRTSTNSRTSRNDVRAFVQKDWLLADSPWFFFGQSEYNYDTIKSWEHRFGAHGGVGYDLNDLLGIDASLRGGFGVTREFGGVDPKTRPESLIATEFDLQLTEKHSLAGSIQYMPSIDGSGYYRVTTDANWDIKLTSELSLRFGVRHEYDNAVPAGFEKHDRRLTGSLVFKF